MNTEQKNVRVFHSTPQQLALLVLYRLALRLQPKRKDALLHEVRS